MKNYTIKRINSSESYKITSSTNNLKVLGMSAMASFHFLTEGKKTKAESSDFLDKEMMTVAAEAFFLESEEISELHINNQSFSRETFFQQPEIWNVTTNPDFPLETWMESNNVSHPKRPIFKAGQLLYSRYVSAIDAHVSFRVIREDDLDTFHDWHNQARVANFWELAQTKEELKAYIERGLNDPHQMPVIAEIAGEAAGYFEIYWTREDRLGPYYESDAFDRGFHLLVGNTKFLGFKNTDALLKSASHFIFLDDPRTRRIMGEPRHDNQKLLRYLLHFKSWRKVKEFDFPHKRAALLECSRELFFQGHYL